MLYRASVWVTDPATGIEAQQFKQLDARNVEDFKTQVRSGLARELGERMEVTFGPIGPPWYGVRTKPVEFDEQA